MTDTAEENSQLSASQWMYCLMYSTISIAAVGGNAIVIYLISNFRQMHTVTNFFILNLAIGDLLMAILCIPFSFTSNLLLHRWPFGALMCRVMSYAQAVSVFISSYTLVAISIDRYIVIIYPLRPRMTKRHSIQLVMFIWLFALLTPAPIALVARLAVLERNQSETTVNSNLSVELNTTSDSLSDYTNLDSTKGIGFPNVTTKLDYKESAYICTEVWDNVEYQLYYSMTLMFLQYFLPFIVLVFTYSRIATIVWGKQTPGEAHDSRDARIAASKRKMIKMMIMCVVTFTLCWLPFNILLVIGERFSDIYYYKNIEYVWFACHWLAMSHATYNPIIYIWMNARFRYGFRLTLGQCFPFLMPRQRRESNYCQSAVHVFDANRPKRSTAISSNGYSYAVITENEQTSLSHMNMNALFVKNRNSNQRHRTSDLSLLSVQDNSKRRLSSNCDFSFSKSTISTPRRSSVDLVSVGGNNSITISVPVNNSHGQNGNFENNSTANKNNHANSETKTA